MKKIILHPARINCPSIPATMKGIVSSVPGVSEVAVRYQERALEIDYDETATTADDIISAIGQETGLHMQEKQV